MSRYIAKSSFYLGAGAAAIMATAMTLPGKAEAAVTICACVGRVCVCLVIN